MEEEGKLTLGDLLYSLRNCLISAHQQKDFEVLNELKTTFTILREVSYESKDDGIIQIIVNLDDSTGDLLIGDDWKANIPSLEDIKAAVE
jgi:hypothetical protein